MLELSRRWWVAQSLEPRMRNREQDDDLFFYMNLPSRSEPQLIKALVDTAPSQRECLVIGTSIFESYFHERGPAAIRPFLAATLGADDLRSVLTGVWPTILRETVAGGYELPLPADVIEWLLSDEAESRRAFL